MSLVPDVILLTCLVTLTVALVYFVITMARAITRMSKNDSY